MKPSISVIKYPSVSEELEDKMESIASKCSERSSSEWGVLGRNSSSE
jgi:hypothetical protein